MTLSEHAQELADACSALKDTVVDELQKGVRIVLGLLAVLCVTVLGLFILLVPGSLVIPVFIMAVVGSIRRRFRNNPDPV